MSTSAAQTAFDPSAPAAERFDAQAELQKSHTALSDLIPRAEVMPVIDYIRQSMMEQELMAKANRNVVPFPAKNSGKKGMQSVKLDDLQIAIMGDYIERPGALGFDSLRAMVDQTPVLSSVILTRVRQAQSFCKVQESGQGIGYVIRHADANHQLAADEQQTINLLQRFFTNCGWEFNPRRRKMLGRDSLRQFIAKSVRDSLTMDSAPIETEFKRDKSLGIDGFYAVDGATIRLCTEEGYNRDDKIYALQVVQGRIRTAYTFMDLVYEARNPRANVLTAGYGLSETELLIKVVTGFLNAMTLNIKGFSDNAIPKGVLHLTGNYGEQDLLAFKRYWNAMVKGVNNAWSLPVLVSKDQDSKAAFENFNVQFDEMYFSKWMTFLTSIICAIYGMDPGEINFESFSASKSSLSGSDTAERLSQSKDSGLRPLLAYYESLFTDYVLAEFGDDYVFRWTGLDEEDQDKRHELKKLVLSVNEARAELGYEHSKEEWGDAPLNPSLVGVWQQANAPQQPGPDMDGQEQHPDYNGEGDGGDQGDQSGDDDDGSDDDSRGGDPGAGGGEPNQRADAGGQGEGEAFGKAADDEASLLKASYYGVGIDDEVFFDHPEHGVSSGKVLAYGKDGFTASHNGTNVGVTWEGFRGHKKRAERAYHVVESGDGGSIVMDSLTGARHFVAGEIPMGEDGDAELDEERSLILGEDEPSQKAAAARKFEWMTP